MPAQAVDGAISGHQAVQRNHLRPLGLQFERCKRHSGRMAVTHVCGVFHIHLLRQMQKAVFPTGVGVFLVRLWHQDVKAHHMCGSASENRPLGRFFCLQPGYAASRNRRYDVLGGFRKAQSPLQQVAISFERLAYRNVLGGQQGSVGAFQIRGRARNGTAMLCQEIIAGG